MRDARSSSRSECGTHARTHAPTHKHARAHTRAQLGVVRDALARASGLLAALDAAAFASPEPAADSAEFAWRHLKAAIVAGYYTSEIGASQELVYEPVPGRFENIRLTPDFRSRSNDGFGGTL